VDPTPAQLRGLDEETQVIAEWMIDELRRQGVPAVITPLGGRRDQAQQRKLVGAGKSKRLDSAHLAGRAFDLDIYRVNRDAVPRAFWELIGPWGEELGLVWGGRWGWDWAHFELP